MNREQRRKSQREYGKFGAVNLSAITYPWQMDDDTILRMYRMRIGDNLMQTKHPFHHRTANGAIVALDPTLEYYRKRLANSRHKAIVEEYERNVLQAHIEQTPDVPPAVPVNRKFYGHDPYERHESKGA